MSLQVIAGQPYIDPQDTVGVIAQAASQEIAIAISDYYKVPSVLYNAGPGWLVLMPAWGGLEAAVYDPFIKVWGWDVIVAHAGAIFDAAVVAYAETPGTWSADLPTAISNAANSTDYLFISP